MLVLAIDTSTPVVTAGVARVLRAHELIALAGGGGLTGPSSMPTTVLAERSVTDAFAHAERLMPLATEALAETGHRVADLEAVVVGLGPGPFTGLRVGIATAAALGDALDVPVHGVPSHDGVAGSVVRAVAGAVGSTDGPLLVATDARRREVYVSAYAADGRRLAGPAVLAPAAVPAWLDEHDVRPAALAGAGADLVAGVLPLPVTAPTRPLTAGLVTRAERALVTDAVPGPLTPLYLRRPDATEPSATKSVLGR
ncbi:tRNA (adenosine(37)-N6)-threonylcarbamoyltransferase complex dimerization subunit type 1 TsaB [Nakamurella leprariae]|uniref:tRNA (Adenosine(37)-N6)-threonylcarbamoyltransferase complex dimerization subunit type 1 TsaB n=1 Tax=Nakamurella leprariae TaxID=2803911 RepID=A0A939C1X9_9ACTN|nr:tRNA (adenosine(37)-N6)-threonylcarbamoyltransferase complex dimerization subunit type 1 TsaB [Nakamurella leprariae]MBM9467577.1 tRNA (adenosine(37)-N6)-threonylcarbamoyltransferase complex dimerization subunit type 1 TsaB [Nakamurella leprariae]